MKLYICMGGLSPAAVSLSMAARHRVMMLSMQLTQRHVWLMPAWVCRDLRYFFLIIKRKINK